MELAVTHPVSALVSAIQKIDDGSGDFGWQHVFREANQVADAMANFGHTIDNHVRIFYFPPAFIYNALRVDVTCISFRDDFSFPPFVWGLALLIIKKESETC